MNSPVRPKIGAATRAMSDLLSSVVDNFSWAKLLYSAVLVAIIALLVTELGRLWFDAKLRVGTCQFFEGGEEEPAQARGFALHVLHHHRILSHLFAAEAARRLPTAQRGGSAAGERGPLQESTWWPNEVVPITDPTSALSDLELSVQGINIKEILTKLRQWVSTPNEATATIEKHGALLRGTATWPKGPSRATGALVDGRIFEIEGQVDASDAAFHVACSLIWKLDSGAPERSRPTRNDRLQIRD